jgi:hypothetical protein
VRTVHVKSYTREKPNPKNFVMNYPQNCWRKKTGVFAYLLRPIVCTAPSFSKFNNAVVLA